MTDLPRRFRPATPSPRSPLGGTLGVVALAFGVGVLGAYMLDLHSHTCEACGHRWRHLGAFNLGDPGSHTCGRCGTVQWWKDGVPHVFRDALRTPAPSPWTARIRQIAQASAEGDIPMLATAEAPRTEQRVLTAGAFERGRR